MRRTGGAFYDAAAAARLAAGAEGKRRCGRRRRGPRGRAGLRAGVAMSHGHSHGGGGCRCAAEREEPPEQRGLAYGLYLRIDLERLQCLNESREGSGRGVFKPWEERTDRSKVGLPRPGAAGRGRGPPPRPRGPPLSLSPSQKRRPPGCWALPRAHLWLALGEPGRTASPRFADKETEARRGEGAQPAV